jgi:hypothetical protein
MERERGCNEIFGYMGIGEMGENGKH